MELQKAKAILNKNRETPLNDTEVKAALSFLEMYSKIILNNLLNQ